METKEVKEVPKWLQEQLYSISEPFTEKMILAHDKANIGWNRFGLNNFAIQCMAMGYYHCQEKLKGIDPSAVPEMMEALKLVDEFEKRHEPTIGTTIINKVRSAIKKASITI